MSFGGKKPTNEFRMKEKVDENLKNTVSEKVFEVLTKNNLIKEKVTIVVNKAK